MNDVLIARTNDVELLMKVRLDFCLELHPELSHAMKNDLETNLREYFRLALQENRYIGYTGYLNGVLCCGAAVLMYSLPPYSTPLPRKCGHILNFFVYPQFRKQGIGDQLIQFIIDDTVKDGFSRLVLNATEAGERVYRKRGFIEPKDKSLILDLCKPATQ